MSHFKVKNLATFITFMILYNFHFYLAPNASVLWLIFHRVEITHFTYPFISQPTLGFFTLFGYYELCYVLAVVWTYTSTSLEYIR